MYWLALVRVNDPYKPQTFLGVVNDEGRCNTAQLKIAYTTQRASWSGRVLTILPILVSGQFLDSGSLQEGRHLGVSRPSTHVRSIPPFEYNLTS